MKGIKERPFKESRGSRNGFLFAWASKLTLFAFLTFTLFWLPGVPLTFASDGATEALELRLTAERAISQERNKKLAHAMEQALPGLLQEYLATRDGTIAMDAIDSAFVEAQFKVARAMEEPGVALAMDAFSGPGSGYENDLRTSISNLADFKGESAERFTDRLSDRTDRVSERTLDVFEREMERQLDKVEQEVAKFSALDRLDSKIEARLDVATARFIGPEKAAERLSERAEKLAETAAALASTNPELAEKLSDKAEKLAEKAEELAVKAEEVTEKVEEKAVERVVDRAAQAAEKAVRDAEDQARAEAAAAERAARAAEAAAQRAEEQARIDAAAAERAAQGVLLRAQQEEQARLDAERAAARRKK